MRPKPRIVLALAIAFSIIAGGTPPTRAGSRAFVRVNQAGYLARDAKVALALAEASLAGETFSLRDGAGRAVFSAAVGADRGPYGTFPHLYELDFSAFQTPGTYRVAVADDESPPFAVGRPSYANLVATSLQFFKVQRCGDTAPLHHGVCHLRDAAASVDLTGGWHDAGDYLKFLINHGGAVALLLSAYHRHPEAFATGAPLPPVLEEARVGLEWIAKAWDPRRQALYYQVGDARDHDEWRMPDGDDDDRPPRRAYACEAGKGANAAGKAAAALALAAVVWGDASSPFRDDAIAARYRALAEQIYKYGKRRQAAQPATDGFYEETLWEDDLALGAAELYRATGKAKYLKDARKFAARAGASYTLDWGQLHALAHYELARVDPLYVPKAAEVMAEDLSAAREAASGNAFGVGLEGFYWGSGTAITGVALEAMWYEDLTGDAAFRALASVQRDYLLGANPWGVSFLNGAGTTWARTPHHQVADITGMELVGYWTEGPATSKAVREQEITLAAEDEYAPFQTEEAVFHDDLADYVTNEPTVFANAVGTAMISWYAAAEREDRRARPGPAR